MTKPALNTHGVRIQTGVHAGQLYTRLPIAYLRHMAQRKSDTSP